MNDSGKVGNDTSIIVKVKTNRIKSNCWKCVYRGRLKRQPKDEMFCTYYQLENPKRNTCARFEKRNGGMGTKKISKPKDKSCGVITWKELQLILLKAEGNLEKFERTFCSECKQNLGGECRKFGRAIQDLTKFPTEIEKWK